MGCAVHVAHHVAMIHIDPCVTTEQEVCDVALLEVFRCTEKDYTE